MQPELRNKITNIVCAWKTHLLIYHLQQGLAVFFINAQLGAIDVLAVQEIFCGRWGRDCALRKTRRNCEEKTHIFFRSRDLQSIRVQKPAKGQKLYFCRTEQKSNNEGSLTYWNDCWAGTALWDIPSSLELKQKRLKEVNFFWDEYLKNMCTWFHIVQQRVTTKEWYLSAREIRSSHICKDSAETLWDEDTESGFRQNTLEGKKKSSNVMVRDIWRRVEQGAGVQSSISGLWLQWLMDTVRQ